MTRNTPSPARALFGAVACLAAAAIAFAIGVWPMLPGNPPPAGVDLEQPLADVAVIARERHPIGSPSNRAVRDYLSGELEALGLEVEIQRALVVHDHPERAERHVRAARVENVLARLGGAGDGPSLVIMSHYDSRADGPGAADAASGVAAVLAAARAMTDAPEPKRDVWFVITDGEEVGLTGAQAFFRQHPAARNVGLVLNFEARGSRGPSMLFETGAGNGSLLDAVRQVVSPVGTSLAYEIYRFMPNDTDMTISKGLGIPGLNFAFADAYYDYHTEGDSPANLSHRSLGEHVHHAVELTRHFAALDRLPRPDGNHTFFLNPAPWPSFSYGAAMGWVLFALALGLTLRWFARDRFAALRPVSELGRALVALLIALLVVSNVVASIQSGLLGGVSRAHAHYWSLFYQYPRAMVGYGLIAVGIGTALAGAFVRGLGRVWLAALPCALLAVLFFGGRLTAASFGVLVVVAALLWWYRRGVAPRHLCAAGAVTWLLLAVVAQFTLATASFIVVLPLLWVAGLALLFEEGPLRDALAVVVPLLLWASLLYGLYLVLGVSIPLVPAVAAALIMMLLAGAAARIGVVGGGALSFLALVAGSAVMTGISTTEPFSARYGQPTELYLAVDADTGDALWRSGDPELNDWLRRVLGGDPERRPLGDILPGATGDTWAAPVEADVAAPRVEIREDRRDADRRVVRLSVETALGGEYVNLMFAPDMAIEAAAIDGQPVPVADDFRQARESDWWRWRFYGDSREAIDIELVLDPASPLRGRLVEVAYRWPAGLAPPPRPRTLMRRPYAWSDATVLYRDFGDTP